MGPWAYFAVKRKLPSGFRGRFGGLFLLGGTQGLVGWWMVRSGLGEDRRGDRKEIRVSPYRLATHLSVAFSIFSLLAWTGCDMLQIPNKDKIKELARSMSSSALTRARRLRVGALGISSLSFLTALSGAFVAGNDAGRAYNTFPKMGDDEWVPWDDLVDPDFDPIYRNAFENTAMVQLNHRVLGCTTAISAVTLAVVGLLHPASRNVLTPQVKRGLQVIGGLSTAQASLGVLTLVNYVPIELAAVHQLGSLALLGSGIYLSHAFRYASPRILAIAQKSHGVVPRTLVMN